MNNMGDCPKCPHCKKLRWNRLVREFNKKYGPDWEVDSYHMLLYSAEEGVIEGVNPAYGFDSWDEFFKACEEYIKERRKEG